MFKDMIRCWLPPLWPIQGDANLYCHACLAWLAPLVHVAAVIVFCLILPVSSQSSRHVSLKAASIKATVGKDEKTKLLLFTSVLPALKSSSEMYCCLWPYFHWSRKTDLSLVHIVFCVLMVRFIIPQATSFQAHFMKEMLLNAYYAQQDCVHKDFVIFLSPKGLFQKW